jgi:hypothetical protein
MSNLSDNEKTTPKSENSSDNSESKAKRWSFIQSDLSNALNTWQELEKAAVKPSPEEEQLVKIKTIISQLRDKLQQF